MKKYFVLVFAISIVGFSRGTFAGTPEETRKYQFFGDEIEKIMQQRLNEYQRHQVETAIDNVLGRNYLSVAANAERYENAMKKTASVVVKEAEDEIKNAGSTGKAWKLVHGRLMDMKFEGNSDWRSKIERSYYSIDDDGKPEAYVLHRTKGKGGGEWDKKVVLDLVYHEPAKLQSMLEYLGYREERDKYRRQIKGTYTKPDWRRASAAQIEALGRKLSLEINRKDLTCPDVLSYVATQTN